MAQHLRNWKSIVSFSPEIDISSHLFIIMMRVIMMIIMIYLMRRSLMLSTRVAAIDAIWKLRHVYPYQYL